MGTPIYPPPAKGDDCLACFPAGETPSSVYVSLTGVKVGDDWAPSLPGPPNGIWRLDQISPCYFYLIDPDWIMVWEPARVDGSRFYAWWYWGLQFFNGEDSDQCIYRFTNTLTNPVGAEYYGGEAQIMLVADPPPISIQEIADLLNIEHTADTMFDFVPAGAANVNILFARIADGMNILVEHDLS